MQKTKKALGILLSLLLVLTALPWAFVPAFAEDEPPASDVSFSYDAATDTLTVTGVGMIPAGPIGMDEIDRETSLERYIRDYPNPEYLNARHVVIGEGITGIGEMAFSLYNMETLSLPSTLESIGNAAFAYCRWLGDVTFPASLKTIGSNAFTLCPQMHTVILPEGLISLGEHSFGEDMINELSIPASLQITGEAADLWNYFTPLYLTALYNASETAVLTSGVYNCGTAEKARETALRYGFLMTGEVIGIVSGLIEAEEADAAQIAEALDLFADFSVRVNAALGTSYTADTIEDVQQMLQDLYPDDSADYGAPAYFTVTCSATGAQHAACAEAGYRHKLTGRDDYCLDETEFSGAENGITWVVDPENRVLTIGGSGTFLFPEGAPWKAAAAYFDEAAFTADCGIDAFNYSYENDPFKGCRLQRITLPVGLRDISDSALGLLMDRIENVEVPAENTTFYTENGVLYRYLTGAKRTALLNEGADPGSADLMLLRVPRNASSVQISARTAVILSGAVYNNNGITSLHIPDSVVSIEENAVYSNSRLSYVSVGKGLKLLSGNAIRFSMNQETPRLVFDGENPWFSVSEGCVWSGDGSELVLLLCPENISSLTLGEGVTSHTTGVFSYAYELQTLTILNPAFDLNRSDLRQSTVVYGYEGSLAERYCRDMGIVFVILERKAIGSIAVLTPPTVTAYTIGDALCTDGLTLEVTYEDGDAAVRSAGYEIGAYDFSTPGEKSIAVTYGGKTTAFSVSVTEAAPEYTIRVGESLPLLMKPTDYSYDYEAIVKYVCEENGRPIPRMSSFVAGASWHMELYDENMVSLAGSEICEGNYDFEAGKTYYIRCVLYVPREDTSHTAVLSLHPAHDHSAETRTERLYEPTCSEDGYEATYCAVCGLYISGRSIPRTPHDVGENGRCAACGKLFSFTIGDGEVVSFATEKYHAEETVTGVYTAAETKTVTVSIMQNSNYGAPYVEYKGQRIYNGVYDDALRTTTFTVDAEAGESITIVVCPAWESDTVVVSVDHTHSFRLTDTLPATCAAKGYEYYTCDACGTTFSKTLYTTEHTPDGVYKEPGALPRCTDRFNGWEYLRCAVCGSTYYQELPWAHTDEDGDGACDVCSAALGTRLALNEETAFTAVGQGYKPFLFTAPEASEYVVSAVGGGAPAYVLSTDLGERYLDGAWDTQTLRVTLKKNETRIFKVNTYDLIDYTVVIRDVHQPVLHEAAAASCTEDGNIAYWTCEICGKAFSDETCRTGIALEDTVIAAAHSLEYHPEVEAFCNAPGMNDYYLCTVCGKTFTGEDPTREVSLESLIVYTMHNTRKVAAGPASCTENGTREYWRCDACGGCFADSAGTEPLTEEALIVPAAHTLVYHPAKAATCKDAGSVAYWTCEVCAKVFADANAANEIGLDETVTPKLTTHTWNAGAVTTPPTCAAKGVRTFTCAVCGQTRTEEIAKTDHVDNNGDGMCDYNCGTPVGEQPAQPENHSGDSDQGSGSMSFWARIRAFFQRIINFFKNIFR